MPVPLQQLGYTTIGPEAYVQNVNNSNSTTVTDLVMTGTIDGVNNVFTALANPFIVAGTFSVIGDTPPQALLDNELGIFTGDGTGTIDYNTGQVTVVFNTAPTVGSTVLATYNYTTGFTSQNSQQFSFELWWFQDPKDFYRHWPDRLIYTPQRPTAVLYYNNQLTFRGPPDTEYHIKIQAYHEEVEFTAAGSLEADYMLWSFFRHLLRFWRNG